MLRVTSEGDLSFISESLRVFSDSSERDFMFIFRANDDCSICLYLHDLGVLTANRYCDLEINVKFLQDFIIEFNFGDFYVEISNTAHHE